MRAQVVDASAMSTDADRLKQEIFERVRQYYRLAHLPRPFVPFESRINYAGRVFDEQEMLNLAGSRRTAARKVG